MGARFRRPLQLVVVILAIISASGLGSGHGELRWGFVDVWTSSAMHEIFWIGFTLTVISVIAIIILLDTRENAYYVPMERAASLVAWVGATLLLAWFWGLKEPRPVELIGAAILIMAIVMLSLAPRFFGEKKKEPAEAAGHREGIQLNRFLVGECSRLNASRMWAACWPATRLVTGAINRLTCKGRQGAARKHREGCGTERNCPGQVYTIAYIHIFKERGNMSIRKLSAVLFMIFLSITVILSGCAKQEGKIEKAGASAPFSDLLKIETGYISGTLIGDVDNPIKAYRGIPYAAPPLGEFRWKPPQPVSPWKEIRQCTAFTGTPPQAGMEGLEQEPQSEDCLYLNVMTPAKTAGESLPVMVWLHGGGYSSGSGNDHLCNLYRLPQHGVVVVTVTMRLNTFGLLAHPLLTAESPDGSSGNYMFLDMIAALQWVKRNISEFGGNPDNVTIFGESGGGSKVSTLMASPMAKGLFHRAICESGSSIGGFLNGRDINEMEAQGKKLFDKLGVNGADDPLKAARALPFEKIMEARDAIMEEVQGDIRSIGLDDATIDGWFLPKSPLELFKSGEYNAVPLITVANLGEITGPGGLLLPQLIPAYVNMHEFLNKAGVKGYAAIFDQVPSKWRAAGAVSTHAMEVLYVFGDYDNRSGWWLLMYGLASQSGAKDSDDPGLTEADRKVSEAMMNMWTQFAGTGDPNVEGMVQWPVYSKEGDKYMYIADPLEIKTGFSEIKPE